MVSVAPDVVCLQEATASTAEAWAEGLRAAGCGQLAVAESETARQQGRSRPLLVLTASRESLAMASPAGRFPWPERVLAVRIGGLLVVNVHSPISPKPELAKVRTHEAVHAFLTAAAGPRVLCGDLNTPRREHPDGRVWTFARDRYGRLREDRGERWDAAELALLRGLEPHGMHDAFRRLHGYERRELSWEWPRWGGGYRLDHLIVSDGIVPRSVEYVHDWRREGLSDHSPLLAELELAPDLTGAA